jgi:hemolysin activation/secretion protein
MGKNSIHLGILVLIFTSAAAWADGDLPPVDTQQAPPDSISTQPGVLVRAFQFHGNTVFNDKQLNDVLASHIGKTLTSDQLEDCRLALTKLYVEHGYINSGAVLPDQTVKDGVVRYNIVEGQLGEVHLTFVDSQGHPTNHLLREHYVLSRVKLGSTGALNLVRLKNQLELLRQDPNIRNINAELRPGAAPGQSVLDLQVHEENPFQAGLEFSNRRPPSVGEMAFDLLASDRDVTGNGDALNIRYDIANGAWNDIQLAGSDDYSVDYTLPITPYDTTFQVSYTETDTVVGETPFQDLGIKSLSNTFAMTVRQPLFRQPVAQLPVDGKPGSPAMEFDVFATGAIRDDRTNLSGSSFDFAPGEFNGTTHITVLRFGQEFTARTQQAAFSARSTVSVGVPWFDFTPNGEADGAGGKFVAWLGQAQYVRLLQRIGPIPTENWQFIARIAGQISDRELPTLEQFAVGGIDSVRGYEENQLVRDQGLTATLEMRIPVMRKEEKDILEVAPFFDVGYAINHADVAPTSDVIYSVGLGFLYNPNDHISARLYYGVPLTSFDRTHTNLQDYGIYFDLVLLAF